MQFTVCCSIVLALWSYLNDLPSCRVCRKPWFAHACLCLSGFMLDVDHPEYDLDDEDEEWCKSQAVSFFWKVFLLCRVCRAAQTKMTLYFPAFHAEDNNDSTFPLLWSFFSLVLEELCVVLPLMLFLHTIYAWTLTQVLWPPFSWIAISRWSLCAYRPFFVRNLEDFLVLLFLLLRRSWPLWNLKECWRGWKRDLASNL